MGKVVVGSLKLPVEGSQSEHGPMSILIAVSSGWILIYSITSIRSHDPPLLMPKRKVRWCSQNWLIWTSLWRHEGPCKFLELDQDGAMEDLTTSIVLEVCFVCITRGMTVIACRKMEIKKVHVLPIIERPTPDFKSEGDTIQAKPGCIAYF